MTKPHVILSFAMSLDGFLDDTSDRRLVLSSPEDLDEVYALRASCDAILVGANTVRQDNPSLTTRDPDLRQRRLDSGLTADPIKIVLTYHGEIDSNSAFFQTGDCTKLVYCPLGNLRRVKERLSEVAEVRGLPGPSADIAEVLSDVVGLGVKRLMVEGGRSVITEFMAADAVDEIRCAISPMLLGRAGGVGWIHASRFSAIPLDRFTITNSRLCGRTAVISLERNPR